MSLLTTARRRRRALWSRRTAAVIVALTLALAGCSQTAGEDPPDDGDETVVTITSVETETERIPVVDLLNRLGPQMGASAPFTGDRVQVTEDMEGAYLGAVKGSSETGEIPADVTGYDDEELLYLGYFYCLALDSGIEPEVAAQGVAISILAHRGATQPEPETPDIALALATANYAAGTLCGSYYDATQAYLDTYR